MRENENEMEQIRKGLENFLEHEVNGREDGRNDGWAGREEPEGEGWQEEPDWEGPEDAEWEEDGRWEEDEARDGRDGYREASGWEEEEPEYGWQEDEESFQEETERRGRPARRIREYGWDGRREKKRSSSRRREAVPEPKPDRKEKKSRRREVSKEEPVKNEGKTKKKKSFFRRLITFLLVLAVAGFGILYGAVSVCYAKMDYRDTAALADKPLKSDGVYSVLLIGSDSRDGSNEGRSDAMILLTMSSRTKTIRMTSLLRDMYVEIPGHEGNRLNAAYAYGGPELLLATVNQNFCTDVNRYVVVNFEAFAGLVDAVGGVELELTNEEVGWVNAYLNEYNLLRGMPIETDYLDPSLSGRLHLNGPQALAYCRNRYIGTDFGRTERQRKVLAEVIRKLPLAALTNPGELINGLFPNLTTNLTQGECLRLGLNGGRILTYKIVQDSLPLEGTYSNATIRGMSVLQVDLEKNRAYIRQEVYGE